MSFGALRDTRMRVAAWMAAGALVPLLGVLGAPATRMPGTPRSDLAKHVWSYWHTLHAVGDWPVTTALGSPDGGLFYDVMLLPALVMAPVTALFGPVAAANLWVWVSLVAVGVSTAALAYRVVGSERGAITAGLVAQFSPFLAGYPLGSGVHERLAIWVFPLVWLGLLAWRDKGQRRGLVVLSVGLFFATAGCQVYGVFVLGMLLFGLPWWWPGLRRVGPALVALAVPLLGAWALVRGPTLSAMSLVPQKGRLSLWPGQPELHAGTGMQLRDLLDPSWVARQEVTQGGDELYMLVYLGWMVLLTALPGAWRARGLVAGFVGTGLALACLAFGPVMLIGQTLFWNPIHVSLSWVLPVFRTIPVPWQAVGAAVPLLAVGVAAFVDRFRGAWVAAVVVGLVVLERAVVLPVSLVLPTTDTTVPEVYAAVDGPVIELPRVYQDTTLTPGEVFLAQTTHEQGLSLSINAGTTPYDRHLPTLRGVSSDWRRDVRCWASDGFRYVVVHRDWLSPSLDPEALVAGLTKAAGAPVADDGVRAVFGLPKAELRTNRPPYSTGMVEVLTEGGLAGGPPPKLPNRAELCPTERRRGSRSEGAVPR